MKLHKIFAVASCSLLLTVATGCNDWLDYTPKDKQTIDQQFSSPEGFHNVVNGIYNTLGSTSLYGKNLSYGAIDIMGALHQVSDSQTSLVEYDKGTWSGQYASAGFSNIWSKAYNTILNINVLLDAFDEYGDVLTKDDRDMMRGEMLAARAWLHLDLARLFGPNVQKYPEGLSVPFADSAEIIKRERMKTVDIINDKIIPDLDKAEELLKNSDPILTDGTMPSDGGDEGNWMRYRQLRLNYYAVCLLKARAYMWVANYDKALEEANKIISPEGQATFKWIVPNKVLGNNTNPDRGFSTECLFCLYNSKISDIYNYTFIGSLDNSLAPKKGFVSKMFPNTGDYRFQVQWTPSLSATRDFDLVKYKSFKTNSNNPELCASLYGLMRIGEAFIIAAECKMRKADIPGAVETLNIFRNARGEEELEPSITQTSLHRELKWETIRELIGEGQVYFMHKRNWQSFGAYMSGAENAMDGSGRSQYFDTPSSSVRYSVPVPTSETY